MTVAARLRMLVGAAADAAPDTAGPPRVSPPTIEGCALILAEASQRGWRVRLEGSGQFSAADAPADLVLSTRAINAVRNVSPADLVATAEAGTSWDVLNEALARANTWIAIDPPMGSGPRTVGSVAATATAGPLRAGFGGVRDHLLGLTLVTGDGRIVKVGGRVAKNVAGYDLTRLAAGSFGAFGLIALVHVRLRVRPKADVTLAARGTYNDLFRLATDVLKRVNAPAAVELISDATDWTLAIRLIGSEAAVAAERAALASFALNASAAQTPGVTVHPISFRLGATPSALAAMNVIGQHVGVGQVSVSVAAGGLRWSGSASADSLIRLRAAAAAREMPLTLERAPWDVLSVVGHFGAYREGVGALVRSLRRAFDPAGILVTPVDA